MTNKSASRGRQLTSFVTLRKTTLDDFRSFGIAPCSPLCTFLWTTDTGEMWKIAVPGGVTGLVDAHLQEPGELAVAEGDVRLLVGQRHDDVP